jgi:hypothetical protein
VWLEFIFYLLWQKEEKALLASREEARARVHQGLHTAANFEEHPRGCTMWNLGHPTAETSCGLNQRYHVAKREDGVIFKKYLEVKSVHIHFPKVGP